MKNDDTMINSSKNEDLILFSNGPGEISTWVFPIAEKIKNNPEINNKYKIILIIHPCQFSSGTEQIYTSRLNLFDAVFGPKDYLRLLFGLKSIRKSGFNRRGVIISLGGDLMHPVLFKFRSRGNYKLFAYTNNPAWVKKYERIFVRNEYIKKKAEKNGINSSKIAISGDLVYSSIKVNENRETIRKKLSLKDDEKMLLFMPGSRNFEVKYMLPVFLKVIYDVTEEFKIVKPFILKSPYVDYKLIEKSLIEAESIKEADVLGGELIRYNGPLGDKIHYEVKIASEKRVPILEGGLEYWGSAVDFAVTVPGTNTIQLAYRKIPGLVVAALNKPEIIPIEGAAGLLKWLPGGKLILRKAVNSYIKKFPFASLPNMYANTEIFPELFGVIKTGDIINRLKDIIKSDEIERIKDRLTIFNYVIDPADLIFSEIFYKNK